MEEYTTPQGFRDVLADEAIMRENIVRSIQDLFARNGYVPIETPTLESLDVMRKGGRVPPSPFRFFDAQGNLVTMRPDVTLQVARMCATRLGDAPGPFRFRYIQRVFRDIDSQVSVGAREKKQMGVECIGAAGPQVDAEIVALFAEALSVAGVRDFKMSLATVGVLRAMLGATSEAAEWKDAVLAAYHDSDFVVLDELCAQAARRGSRFAPAIGELARIRGGREAIDEARALVAPLGCAEALEDFQETYDQLAGMGLQDRILVDFSVMSSFDYYTGIVFEAFAPGLGSSLGGGGRYDKMLGAYGVDRPAAGFAFYLEEVQSAISASGDNPQGRPIRIAVPKGSLNPDSISVLADAGFDVSGLDNPGRSLIIRNSGVDYIIVRPSDAPVFVELGAADCGICGQDSLLESGADVVPLVDLRFGACRFIVAESADAAQRNEERYRSLGSIRVATKYPSIARSHFARTGKQVEIVQLHGNIELGPLTGLADCIVDITATGTTLRENNLVITDEVMSSTARFFANVCSLRTDERVRKLAQKLGEQVSGRDLKVTAGGAVQGA
ncbi:MAG TPA: ATP phosphoribosyltransferase [Eggerthellaceae bacterium]|nr:ATP phosphoribosyltransferase [Eggerthellaceae bacterium]